ncbi:MAG: hypothetical protein JRM88_06265 [Nitrososphaerota archaeon]|nr:hypothetical protein [Nitrososphaerota archaeon]MDG6949885.1 hypothetical protein [Nitrososphaerota archaeon]
MDRVELVSKILDSFDRIYSDPSTEESAEALKEALAGFVQKKETPDSWGFHIKTNKLVDLLVPFMLNDKPSVSREEVTRLFFAILDASPEEIKSRVASQVRQDRLPSLVMDVAKKFSFNDFAPSDERDRAIKPPQRVFVRSIDGWDLVLSFFPERIYHHLVYGYYPAYRSYPQINQKLMLSLRRVEEASRDPRRLSLDRFLKSPELDELAGRYGISYHTGDSFGRSSEHKAQGGYQEMMKSLAKELERTPYSAEKLIQAARCPVHVIWGKGGLSLHLAANDNYVTDTYNEDGVNRRNVVLVLGFDLEHVPREDWSEFKKAVPAAVRSLRYLDFPTKRGNSAGY